MSVKKYLSSLRDYDMDDVLGTVGLQRRSSGEWVFPMLAGLGAGLAIGAGLAFFLTPYKGAEAREKVKKGASDAQKALSDKVSSLSDKVSSLMGEKGEKADKGEKAIHAAHGDDADEGGPAHSDVPGASTSNRSY
jgi:gas vesicle protein